MLREIHVANGANGYTNTGNGWAFFYGSGTVTVKDAAGNVTKLTNLPTWCPPGFSITTGTSTDILIGLYSDKNGTEGLQEFAGFLSKAGSALLPLGLVTGGPSIALGATATGQDVLSVTEGLVVGNLGATTPKGFILQGGAETMSVSTIVTVV